MKQYKYLIVGGGMTGDAAARGIRELDPESSIGMISSETDKPYARPPLSKGMWKGRPFERIWRNTEALNVDLNLGREVTEFDPAAKRLHDDQGEEYAYEKLLLATGGSPIRLPFGEGKIIYYRTLGDYLHLRKLVETKQNFLVIGGGFIGTEIAAALTMQGRKVTMVFLENSIGEAVFPQDLSHYLNDYYTSKGVGLVPAEAVSSVEEDGDGLIVRTRGGGEFHVDGVVAGIGLRPNISMAKSAGLKVDNGIVVDEQQRTSAQDVYAAGDVAMFPHKSLGRMIHVEHEDNALSMGRQAGRNMAGAGEDYTHTPSFYSDLFELGYEAVGELNSRLETVADWQEPWKKGVVYYLENGRVRGVLLWNVWKKLKEAAALLEEPGPFKPEDLAGRIRVE